MVTYFLIFKCRVSEEHMRAVLKVSPILLCWPTASKADGDGTAVEVETSRQYPITFWCRVTDGSRGAVWQNSVWHGSAYEAMVWHWIPPCKKTLHPLTFINSHWMFTKTKQHLWTRWGGGWCVSVVATAMWKTSSIPDSHAQLSHHKMKTASISSPAQICGLWPVKCV